MEDIEYHQDRKMDKEQMLEFSICRYISDDYHIILKGASAGSFEWIACYTCDGILKNIIKAYQKSDFLILDEFLLSPVSTEQTRELLEIIEASCVKDSIIFCNQFELKGSCRRIGSGCDATSSEIFMKWR